MKQCSRCRKLGVGPKPKSEFCKGSDSDGLQSMCREHTREYNREWVKRNPEKNRAKGKRFREVNPIAYRKISTRAGLRNRYGISETEFNVMFAKQNGRCPICETRLVSQLDETREFKGHAPNEVARVDHDHETGKVRGLLCFSCNVGLGKFRDDETTLLKAVRYLRASATEPSVSRPRVVKPQSEIEPVYQHRDLNSSARRGSRRDTLSPF